MKECQEAFDMIKALWTSGPILAFVDFTEPFKLHIDASTTGLDAFLYQEQDWNNQVIGYASWPLSKSEFCYPAHKLEFLALKWVFTKYLHGNTFTVYSNNNPLTYVLIIAKLDVTGHWWIFNLAKFNFTIHYHLGKSNVNADTLSRIQWDQNIEAYAVGAIFKATVHGPEVLMEVYIVMRGLSVPLSWNPLPPEWLQQNGFRLRRQTQLLGR